MRIDAHQHFWKIEARAGAWPPPALAAIHRSFEPEDLMPLLARSRVAATVLVQSLPTLADTDALLAIAAGHGFVRGVVGWVDLEGADAAREIAARVRPSGKLRGLRLMLHDLDDPEWIRRADTAASVDAMLAHRLVLDALVRPAHLPALLAFAQRHPTLPIVVDHAAKPPLATGVGQGWADGLAALAELPQVVVKLSGLLTEAAPGAGTEVVAPVVERLLTLFGTDRIIWGSDWPVLRLAGDYGDWLAMCEALVPVAAHEAVFGGNAVRVFRLDEGEE